DLGNNEAPSNSLQQRNISTTLSKEANSRNLLVVMQQPENISYHATSPKDCQANRATDCRWCGLHC
ncbi:hypothetical protein K443DRAFT_656553, partial [Laccaria amethystina LaAM-08-1]